MTPDDWSTSSMISAMLTEILWFAAGLIIVRLVLPKLQEKEPASAGAKGGGKRAGLSKAASDVKRGSSAWKALCDDAAAGRYKEVLAVWHREKEAGPMTVPGLQAVTQALLEMEPDSLCEELLGHLSRYPQQLCRPGTLPALMETILSSAKPCLAATLAEAAAAYKGAVGAAYGQDAKTQELRLVSLAAEGKKEEVQLGLKELASEARLTCSAAAVRGFLKGKRLDLALQLIEEMQQEDVQIPSKALTAVIRAACEGSQSRKMLQVLEALKDVVLPAEAIAYALTDCLARDDAVCAAELEQRMRLHKQISYASMEPLLKMAAKSDEEHALELFQEMRQQGFHLSEGLCGLLLSRCGESHHLKLAEEVRTYLKDKGMMTLAIYRTLMKVYATCHLYDHACDLYQDLKADKIEPDRVMYGCLVKFATRCGRHSLCAELFQKIEDTGGDVQNYMWLIRSAGQAGDVRQALDLFKKLKLKSRNADVDAATYNCVLDACLSNGAMQEAEDLLEEMRRGRLMTLVTYNTLMKGLCVKGQLEKARKLLHEMTDVGLMPDCASYNCLISAAVGDGNFRDAWSIFDQMEAQGLAPDHYTLSILMKAARKSKSASDADRAMSLMDSSKINICGDEVLVNTVLDACICRKDYPRLRKVLASFHRSELQASVHCYGLLIKAYSCLRQPGRCWDLWKEMTETRGLTPNDVTMSCMLDAIVCAGKVEEAAALLHSWRNKVRPNTVVYSTLIKGFASKGDAEGASAIYRELKEQGLQMNQVAFTALIDAHVRAEQMDQAENLLKQMQADGIEPNTITYSSLVKGYCRTSSLDLALKTFADMLAKGLAADTVIFNTLLDGAVRASRFDLCDQLLNEMSQHGVGESNFTLSIVIKMWGKRRRLEDALKAARDSARQGKHRLDAQTCTCLISACLHNHAPQRAIAVLKEMKSWPNCDGPNASSYSMLISGLLRCNMIQEAAAVATEALQLTKDSEGTWAQQKISPEVLSQLFKALQKEEMHADLHYLDRLLKAKS